MKFIKDLSWETEKVLERFYKDSKHSQVRQRAHCILLSFRGFKIQQLMAIFALSRQTIHYWQVRWEDKKLVGLYDQMGRIRKTKLTSEQQKKVNEWVKAEPKSLKKVIN